MSLLLTSGQLASRTSAIRGDLSALAEGLRAELEPVLASVPEVPREKALLSRQGGRCAIDGALLIFDPLNPRHFCPKCGREYAGGLHDRFRLYWYQLWLAERTLHAALLAVLTYDERCRDVAIDLLDRVAQQYLRYPNADNVLGPSRPFFSTYLESIWLLQLSIALDLLETGAPSPEVSALGARVRDKLIAPSVALIGSYDEGMSNRQVWNNAAMMAAARLLDDRVCFDKALNGPSGLHVHLERALLPDGSWYEGENYHLFAHRGLWYGTQLTKVAGFALPTPLAERMQEGFVAPFRTLLPDLTYPSRRDSQYAVSVRQPRFAESCELGIAGRDDPRLLDMLARLYAENIPRGETGRRSSTADVERNLPPMSLKRADLSWRTLLFARPMLPPLVVTPLVSDLLPSQGLGILRRDEGALYVSLDYGHSGGGHGHPDRLNLSLADRDERWFDDPGTGSYVDDSLHWYRSTLAHNAPLINGRSQKRVHGQLVAFSDDGRAGWISAQAPLAKGLVVTRTVVVLDDYLIDELSWVGDMMHEVALPMHRVVPAGRRARPSTPIGRKPTVTDGFTYLADITRVTIQSGGVISLRGEGVDEDALRGWMFAPQGAALFAATTPSTPGSLDRSAMALLRHTSAGDRFVSVWTWADSIKSIDREEGDISIERRDGTRHTHKRLADGWNIELVSPDGSMNLVLGGHVLLDRPGPQRPSGNTSILRSLPAAFELGESNYRRSEISWQGGGGPTATVTVARKSAATVTVEIDVPFSQRLFVPVTTENQLDNEPASINGDSIQLYAVSGERNVGVLLVPDGGGVAARPVDGWQNDLAIDARWHPTGSGYHITVDLHIDAVSAEFRLDVLINDVVPGRARRRGQLVLSGAAGEFVYLRGDRQDPSCLLRFSFLDA